MDGGGSGAATPHGESLRGWLVGRGNMTQIPVACFCVCMGGEGGGAMSTSWSGGAAACERFGSGSGGLGRLCGASWRRGAGRGERSARAPSLKL
eukprot:scaffold67068_cov25-Tisochrysis_lutea.AAC.1